MTEAAKPQPCNCIADINAKLDGQELESGVSLWIDMRVMGLRTSTLLIRKDTGKRETRSGRPKRVMHKFCPFCGAPYEPALCTASGDPA